jgi:hypothetical protein
VIRAMLALVLVLASACACKLPSSTSSPGPDASTAQATCSNLAQLGCAIGADAQCVSRIELSISEQRVTAAQITCARTATTKAMLNVCTPYFGCP